MVGRGEPVPAVERPMGQVLPCVTFDRSATYAASHHRLRLSSKSASSLSQCEVKSLLKIKEVETQQMEPINLPSKS